LEESIIFWFRERTGMFLFPTTIKTRKIIEKIKKKLHFVQFI